MRPTRSLALAVALVCGALGVGRADDDARFELTVDSIMRGPKLVGHAPSNLRWSGDGRWLYFEWLHEGEDEAATWVVAATGGEPRRLSDAERRSVPAAHGVWDTARRRIAFADDGALAVVDSVAHTRRQLTHGGAEHPRWARHDSAVTFTRDGALLLASLDGSGDLQTPLVSTGLPKPAPKTTPSQSFIKTEEEQLIVHVREAEAKRKRLEEKQKLEAPPRVETREGESLADALLTPDETHAWLLVADKGDTARKTIVPSYVTATAYTEDLASREDVGDTQPKTRLAVIDLKSRKSVWASVAFAQPAVSESGAAATCAVPTAEPALATPASEPLPAPLASPAPSTEAACKAPAERAVVWSLPKLSRDGRTAVAQVLAADNKDAWLVALDPDSGEARVVQHEHDDAWVRPLADDEDAGAQGWGFLPDGQIWFTSEASGWMQLYAASPAATAAPARALTSGAFEIDRVALSRDGRSFWLTSSEGSSAERHVFTMSVGGGARTRASSLPGENDATPSPDGRTVAYLHSSSNRPPEVYLDVQRPGVAPRQVTTSTSDTWRSHTWLEPKLVTYAARDGAMVTARLYTPEMVGAERDPTAPAVVFVHGAGYLQNAHRYWSYYYREYMFHHLLASRGYVVLDPDYRGSAGYGRDWRTGIYRHMGGSDLDDVVDGARWLVANEHADPKRLGVYGGSYGGFLTLMAMFTAPDTFAAGAALRPVTDWAHYNHGYTSNILNAPQDDAEAFRRSSPIYFAEGLKGALLICHGMLDVNVHFQDSVRLAQRLIELRKTDWELAGYPVQDHAFDEETSWADEYKRILKLFEERLRLPRY